MDKKKKFVQPELATDLSRTDETMSSTAYEEPFRKKFPQLLGEEDLPCLENDYSRAKAYLMKQCLNNGDNLWDHLNDVLHKILIERPKDIGDTFEQFSYRLRQCKFKAKTDHLQDMFVPPTHYDFSMKMLNLLMPVNDETVAENTDNEEEERKPEPDIMETFYYFEQGGIGLPRDEVFYIARSLKKFFSEHPVANYRFWGKILGTRKNYYVVETELLEEEMSKLNSEREEKEEKARQETQTAEEQEKELRKTKKILEKEEAKQREIDFANERSDAKYKELIKEYEEKGIADQLPEKQILAPWPSLPLTPEPPIIIMTDIPVEANGVGVNKKTYFVCNDLGGDWVQLPDATPKQISRARQIKRAFTGNLESEIVTFPTFPGKEKNYLRAQIARISAGTQISPLGFYTFNEEDEEEEEAGVEGMPRKTNYVENPEYEPVPIRDLTDISMSFWVHHTQYILEQGRTTWWSPKLHAETEEEGETEEEEDKGKEIGPELLTPLSEDSALDEIQAWSVRKTSVMFPDKAIAIVRSNLWPGAYAYAYGRKFDNIYIGFGQKFTGTNHSPIPIKDVQDEYPVGPEILEILDPTPEQEEEWKLSHEVKKEPAHEEEEEEFPQDEDED